MNTRASQSESSTSSSLLARAKAGDPDAWETLTQLYGPLVYSWARRAGLQATDASDVVQEVFQAVAGAIERFRRDRPSDRFRGWLWTITKNKIHDHFRDRTLDAEAKGGTTAHVFIQDLPDSAPEDSEESPRLDAAGCLAHRAMGLMRSDFEERTWQAFWGVCVEEPPASEVADELDMSTAAVYMAKSRVLRRLRQELDGTDLVD